MRARGLLAGAGLLGLLSAEAVRSVRVAGELHQAQDQARHDELTGLLNRAGMGRAVAEAVERDGQSALLLIDLDGFKQVNDTYGHAAGDAVLVEVAERISGVLAAGETAARHGGDEYSVLTPARPGPWVRSRVAAIAAAVRGPMTLPSGDQVLVRASVGAAVAADVRELWEAADRAMYARKAARRGHSVEMAGVPVGEVTG